MNLSLTNLDFLLIALTLTSLFVGWKRGLIMEAFAIFGIALGVWLANNALKYFYGASTGIDAARVTISTSTFIAGVVLGSAFGAIVGSKLQKILMRGPLKLINKIGGALFSTFTLGLVVWLVSSYLLLIPNSTINSSLNDSTIVGKLDELAPDEFQEYLELARDYATESQLPEIAIDVIIGPDIPQPDPAIVGNENIVAALDSVVRVESVAEECNAKLSGSGFVIADNLIATNAHVVAGIVKPEIRLGGKGKTVTGEVIYFDPRVDLALIRTTKLVAPALAIGDDLRRNEMAVVAGFPLGGPLELSPARVRAVATSTDPDIYGQGQVTRELYVLNTEVQQGDSGSALINEDGKVSGVIFAASADDNKIGYALMNSELIAAFEKAKVLTERADTGKCLPVEEKTS
jgi:S1-C subfamily serine protease